MSGKAILCCVGLKPVCRGTLRGFANIAFADLRMTVHGIGIHVHENGSSRKARGLDHKNCNAENVLAQMRAGARLLLHYCSLKPTWLLNPDGAVAPRDGAQLDQHIVCLRGRRLLFPNCLAQTFRYIES